MKKKILSVIICAAAVLSLTACGKNEEPLDGITGQGANSTPEASALQSSVEPESKPEESSAQAEPAGDSTGTVTIDIGGGLWLEYDIATTTEVTLSGLVFDDGDTDKILSAAEKLTNLTYLELWGNRISDVTPLANLTKLAHLELWDNRISDVTPLANLTNLTYLSLQKNKISDITPLANLTNLTLLDLKRNQISDVTPLANLTNLDSLSLDDNQISDIKPLANLTNLKYLYLGDNQISDEDKEWLKTQLPNCELYF